MPSLLLKHRTGRKLLHFMHLGRYYGSSGCWEKNTFRVDLTTKPTKTSQIVSICGTLIQFGLFGRLFRSILFIGIFAGNYLFDANGRLGSRFRH
jgi:hypothetical protein